MGRRRPDLPDFESPPLDEVAIAVQFNTISDLQAPHMGLLWQRFRGAFPRAEQHPPLEYVIESFDFAPKPTSKIQIRSGPLTPRYWFLNEHGTELVQVQQDRFVQNWRKVEDGQQYPRYEYIQTSFVKNFGVFQEFLDDERLGSVIANQCSVTYVNRIFPCEVWSEHKDAHKVITLLQDSYSDDFLWGFQQLQLGAQYLFKDEQDSPLGFLYISLHPALKLDDSLPILTLELTARGRPDGEGLDGIMRFFDKGREVIVRGFASVTTKAMHNVWRRKI